MRDLDADTIAEKNSEENRPVWLYDVAIADGVPDWHITEHDEIVSYGGIDYIPFPVRHHGIEESGGGAIDSFEVGFGVVSQELLALVELYSGLENQKVVVHRVFLDALADTSVKDVYYIDSHQYTDTDIVFKLSTRLDVLSVHPLRRYSRTHCWATYKDIGCYLDDGDGTYSQPSGFQVSDAPLLLNKVVSGSGTLAVAAAKFKAVELRSLVKANDSLVIDLKCSNPALMTAVGQLEITSSGGPDSEEWAKADLTGLGITTDWQTLVIPLSGFAVTGGNLDISAINYIRWYNNSSGASITVSWRNAYIRIAAGDVCYKTFPECLRHNNGTRYGGQPSVPEGKMLRV